MKIVADAHIPYITDYFSSYGELILKSGRTISSRDVKDADLLLVRSITLVNEVLLKNSKVKFVGSVTAGADHLDMDWLNKAGIKWRVASGFNAPPVADYVVSLIAALNRKGLLNQRARKAAVIGVGQVGRLVVERLQWLGFEVICCDPVRAMHETNFISTPLDALAEVDLISVHVPLIKNGLFPTYHFIDKAFLQRQKTGCVLINASRGAVINSKDLLQYGSHLHWCFDVWEHEPTIDKTLLANALMATPHIAGYSIQSKIRGIDIIYRAACEEKFIRPCAMSPITIPKQRLMFAGHKHHWQDIILGVFNPLLLTAMMRTVLLPASEDGHSFDEMRNQFNYRHEFAFTTISGVMLPSEDQRLLEQLGLSILP